MGITLIDSKRLIRDKENLKYLQNKMVEGVTFNPPQLKEIIFTFLFNISNLTDNISFEITEKEFNISGKIKGVNNGK